MRSRLVSSSILASLLCVDAWAQCVSTQLEAQPPVAANQTISVPGTVDLFRNQNFLGTPFRAVRPTLRTIPPIPTDKSYVCVLVETLEGTCVPTTSVQCAESRKYYYARYSDLQNSGADVQQLVTGILAVPFKFHTNDHATTAGATIGGYVGYEFYKGKWDISWDFIGAGGLALVPQKAATIGSKADPTPPAEGSTLTGVSLAVGIIGRAKSNVQFGLLIGTDWVGKDKSYKYEGKPWISFAIGYNFAGN